MEVIDETQAQLESTLETKSLTFAYLKPLFLHGTRLLLMLDTWSMKPYTCMNFHTSSHLKVQTKLFQELPFSKYLHWQINLVFLKPDINECASMPCLNGGVCEDLLNNYTCTCIGNFTGSHCETGVLLLSWGQPSISLYKCQPQHIIQSLFLFPFAMGKMFNDRRCLLRQPPTFPFIFGLP